MNSRTELAAATVTSSMAAAMRKLWEYISFLKNFIATEHDMPLSSVKCFYFAKIDVFTNVHQDNILIIALPVISYLTEANKHIVHGAVSLTKLSFLQMQDFH